MHIKHAKRFSEAELHGMESNCKHFYNIEKRNYSRKLATKVKLNNGSFTTTQFDILEEQQQQQQNP